MFRNGIQEDDIPASIHENIHDVHHEMTLNDSYSNNSPTHLPYSGATNTVSTAPARVTYGKQVENLKKPKRRKQTQFQPISRNIEFQRHPLMQLNSTDHGRNENACYGPAQSTIEEIKFDSEQINFENSSITKLVPSMTNHDEEASYSLLDSIQQALLAKMLQQPIQRPDRISEVLMDEPPDQSKSDSQINNSLIRKEDTRDLRSSSLFRVPSKLPRFRGGSGGINDPEEFLEIFGRICYAHGVPIQRFPAIMATCLDNINARWFESYLGSLNRDVHWQEIASTFCNHFQNPNIAIMQWLSQLHSLRMDKDEIQRYSDQFITFAQKLNWNLGDDMVIYQYKSGLSTWMLDQLSVAESNHLLALETQSSNSVKAITVKILAKLAIRIEANKAIQIREPQQSSLPTEKPTRNVHFVDSMVTLMMCVERGNIKLLRLQC